MRTLPAGLLAATVCGCASNRDLERKVDALTVEVKALRASLERARTGARLTMVLRDADVREAIAQITRDAQVDIAVPAEVGGRVTLSIDGVAWDVVLETVAKTLFFSNS